MRKIIAILGTLIAALLLTACTETTPGATPTGGVFIGGTTGMVASFEPFSVKEGDTYAIFDSEDFPIDVRLTNKGEETVLIGKVSLKLLGPAQTDFQNIPSWTLTNIQEIEKVSEFNPNGGEEIVTFTPSNNRAKYTATVTGYNDITWNLEYAYDYKTHLIINDICFKGDVTDPTVCNIAEAKTFAVSGAPITVTSVEEDTAGKGIVLVKVNVKNGGTGKATVPGREFDQRFDQVAFSVDEPEKWECKSGGRENEARLTQGSAQITCRLKTALADSDLYVRNLRLTFNYVYKESIQDKLRIKESVR